LCNPEIIAGTYRAHFGTIRAFLEDQHRVKVQPILNRIVAGELDPISGSGIYTYAAVRDAIIEKFSAPYLSRNHPPLSMPDAAALIDATALTLYPSLLTRIEPKYSPGSSDGVLTIREGSPAEIQRLSKSVSEDEMTEEDRARWEALTEPTRRWQEEIMETPKWKEFTVTRREVMAVCTLTRAEGIALCTLLRWAAQCKIDVRYYTADGGFFSSLDP